ncbi:sulfite exporter TauE/SafE family protein [Synechococcus sp. ATX 2A4]|uniref:sulfite exporter TauE/SafE family protein n=1 Tax=Synechococcus sp. ATX 2A4 TaxID=2823727 RepID=UPI0020CBE9EB|nr:sulfite exporter TauE/SafE family protein [Synechococcus sp. ATX 2A4]MCP9883554.1 sulfite exporter TauE/SafE family protein [Synechococcus sp. ATX 2A4]
MSVALLALLAAGGGLIGFLLAVLGAGGSILLMPLLVSGAALPTREAVPLSLLVVTLLAVVNAGPYLRRRQVAVRPALILGLPALAGSWIGGRVVKAGLVSEPAQLLIFAFAALVAAWLMLRRTPATARAIAPAPAPARGRTQASARSHNGSGHQASALLAGQGLVVGLLTGVAGVGGGFALVPALVLIAGLPMQLASGTSLVLIAANSLVALAALGHWPAASLPFTLPLIGGGLVGAALGQRLAPHLPDRRLRQGFAALLVGSALLTGFSASQRHAGATGRSGSLSTLQRQSSQGSEGTIAGVRSR